MSLCNCKYLTRDMFSFSFSFPFLFLFVLFARWHGIVTCTLNKNTHTHVVPSPPTATSIRSPVDCWRSISNYLDSSIILHCIINWTIATVSFNTNRCTVRRQHCVVRTTMCAGSNWRCRSRIVGINRWQLQRKMVSKLMGHTVAAIWPTMVQPQHHQRGQRQNPHRTDWICSIWMMIACYTYSACWIASIWVRSIKRARDSNGWPVMYFGKSTPPSIWRWRICRNGRISVLVNWHCCKYEVYSWPLDRKSRSYRWRLCHSNRRIGIAYWIWLFAAAPH